MKSDNGTQNSASTATTNWAHRFLVAAVVMLGLRIIVLLLASHELGPDETQYWFWSETPAFGYFSKPPLIAWTIAATTAVFGDAEWAVRLAAPLFQTGTAAILFALARRLYNAETAFWVGLTWLLMPGVSVSSAIVSTDALLLFFWSAALYALWRLADPDDTDPPDADKTKRFPITYCIMLGGAIGLGFLAKYAMVYFLIGLALLPIAHSAFRTRPFLAPAITAVGLGVLIMSPNILWNMENDFQTLTHTAANANWRSDLFHPVELLEFLGSQFGLAGPIMIPLMVAAVIAGVRERASPEGWKSVFLMAFTLPPIAIVSVQAFISRAHANWAAAAYPAATILAVAFVLAALRAGKHRALRRSLPASAALHGGIFVVMSAMMTAPSVADAMGLGGAFKRLRGWEEQSADIAERASAFDAILCDDREVMGGLLYYADTDKPILAWESNQSIDHHYEAFHRFEQQDLDQLFFVSIYADGATGKYRFAEFEPLGESTVSLGAGRTRTLYLFRAADRLD